MTNIQIVSQFFLNPVQSKTDSNLNQFVQCISFYTDKRCMSLDELVDVFHRAHSIIHNINLGNN